MKSKDVFLCTRSSSWNESQPCEEAFQIEVMEVDSRTTDDPKKVRAYNGTDSWWYNTGTNHRVENGKICRDLGLRKVWAVEIRTLEDFRAFVSKHGQCIVAANEGDAWTIEIYDDYRE